MSVAVKSAPPTVSCDPLKDNSSPPVAGIGSPVSRVFPSSVQCSLPNNTVHTMHNDNTITGHQHAYQANKHKCRNNKEGTVDFSVPRNCTHKGTCFSIPRNAQTQQMRKTPQLTTTCPCFLSRRQAIVFLANDKRLHPCYPIFM